MSRNTELQQRKNTATPRGVGVLCDFYAARARNAEVWDLDGRRFIDFAGGIGVLNTGHLHPRVTAAVQQQLTNFSHTCYQVVPYESYIALAERLNTITPGAFAKKTAFFSTGAEAVENAVKIARAFTGRSGLIAFHGAFHGRTHMGMALTGKVSPYKLGFGPFPADVFHVPYPNALYGVSEAAALAGLQQLFKCDIDPQRVAAMIIEPVQGEGGFYVAPTSFLQALRKLCDQHGILLIADEIQSGFARTGKLFAIEHTAVVPDLLTSAKSLAGGYPLAAVTGRADVMDAPAPGGLGGTYAGNPLALAAAHAVLDVIADEKLCERATQLGHQLKERLAALKEDIPQIADVRGLGSMVALEVFAPGTQEPDADYAKRAQQYALQHGLLLLTCGTSGNVLRFLYPLTIEDTVFNEGLDILVAALMHARNT